MAAKGRKIAVVGESGAGKGTLVKKNLEQSSKPRFILSTVNDYGGDVKIFFSFESLIDACMGPEAPDGSYPQQVRDVIIIIDEAQVWLPKELKPASNKLHRKFLMLLANAGKFNNLMLFLMHGFHQMPSWMPTYINDIQRFYTNENLRIQIVRFPQFPQLKKAFEEKPVLKLHESQYIHLR